MQLPCQDKRLAKRAICIDSLVFEGDITNPKPCLINYHLDICGKNTSSGNFD